MRKILQIGVLVVLTTFAVGTAVSEQPTEISITVKGGLGVQAIVENVGNETLKNISWEITVEKAGKIGLVLFGTKNGTIETLQPGENITIPGLLTRLLPPTVGFGKVNITVTVGEVTEKAQGTLVGILFVGVKEI